MLKFLIMHDQVDFTVPVCPPETLNKIESPFYPGVSQNRLLFHGTRSKVGLDGILSRGLEPPDASAGRNTMSRKMSFTDFHRYSGHDGFIICLRPEVDEIDFWDPQYSGEVALASGLRNLPPERAVFYLPGSTGVPYSIFNQTKALLADYYSSGHDNQLLFSRLGQLVATMEDCLKSHATLLGDCQVGSIHQMSQEIIWNELCGQVTFNYQGLYSTVRMIEDIRGKTPISSAADLRLAWKTIIKYGDFDPAEFLHELKFFDEIGSIPGLGFEGFLYPIPGQVEELRSWIEVLPEETKPPEAPLSTKARIKKAIKHLLGK